MQKSRRNPALSVLGGPPVPPSRGPPAGALTEFGIFSTDSARYRSNGRETGIARQPQWVEKAAVRSPGKPILVLTHPFLEPSIGERLQHKGMEPLRLTCGASSDPVGVTPTSLLPLLMGSNLDAGVPGRNVMIHNHEHVRVHSNVT